MHRLMLSPTPRALPAWRCRAGKYFSHTLRVPRADAAATFQRLMWVGLACLTGHYQA